MNFSGINVPNPGLQPAGQALPRQKTGSGYRNVIRAEEPGTYQTSLLPNHPWAVVPTPLIALGSIHVTCQQWHSLSQPWKLSLVRGVLEARGFSSLNNSVRGKVVYDLVHKIDAYCTMQIARMRAPRAAGQVRVDRGFMIDQLQPHSDLIAAQANASNVRFGRRLPVQTTGAPQNLPWQERFLRDTGMTCAQFQQAIQDRTGLPLLRQRFAIWARQSGILADADVNYSLTQIQIYCGGVPVDRGFMTSSKPRQGFFGVNMPGMHSKTSDEEPEPTNPHTKNAAGQVIAYGNRPFTANQWVRAEQAHVSGSMTVPFLRLDPGSQLARMGMTCVQWMWTSNKLDAVANAVAAEGTPVGGDAAPLMAAVARINAYCAQQRISSNLSGVGAYDAAYEKVGKTGKVGTPYTKVRPKP